MAKSTEVILRAEVVELGHAGDLVEVAPGYARNYLVPRGLAYVATEANKHRVAQEKKKYEERLAAERVEAEKVAATLEGQELRFERMAGEEDQLYGSVSSTDVADALAAAGIEIERTQVRLDQPIKALGEYDVPIRLHPEVTVPVKVIVERERM
ncbi:MAG TPA: 50S ribosomal protein L9 [Gemmatimonadota bacterium]|nr:50S ribosomal protein L9 [Gemmatimonadota bacterium]